MYFKKLADIQRFRPSYIATARRLFERYGFSLNRVDQHPDNTDPHHFKVPSNLAGVVPNLGSVEIGGNLLESAASAASMASKEAKNDVAQQSPAAHNDSAPPAEKSEK